MKYFILFFFLTSNVFAVSKLARVTFVKGSVKIGSQKVTKGQWLDKGAVVKTGPRSIVRILLKDKTKIAIGPKTSLEITNLKKSKASMVTLLQGVLRSKVQKDYLGKSKDKNKLYITTKTAAMGVRGTDFNVVYNEANKSTNVITFNGEVAMVQKDPTTNVDYSSVSGLLESENSVAVTEGRFSSTIGGSKATIPVKLSPSQYHSLKNNRDFSRSKTRNKVVSSSRSIVLPGVKASKISDGQSGLKSIVGKKIIAEVKSQRSSSPSAPPPEGFVDERGRRAPPAGGYLDLKTGIYVAPPPGSVYDENTGVFIPPANFGTFDPATGSYQPPAGFELNVKGEFVATTDASMKSDKAPPVINRDWDSPSHQEPVGGSQDQDLMNMVRDVLNEYNNTTYDDSINRRTMVNMKFAF